MSHEVSWLHRGMLLPSPGSWFETLGAAEMCGGGVSDCSAAPPPWICPSTVQQLSCTSRGGCILEVDQGNSEYILLSGLFAKHWDYLVPMDKILYFFLHPGAMSIMDPKDLSLDSTLPYHWGI